MKQIEKKMLQFFGYANDLERQKQKELTKKEEKKNYSLRCI